MSRSLVSVEFKLCNYSIERMRMVSVVGGSVIEKYFRCLLLCVAHSFWAIKLICSQGCIGWGLDLLVSLSRLQWCLCKSCGQARIKSYCHKMKEKIRFEILINFICLFDNNLNAIICPTLQLIWRNFYFKIIFFIALR